MNYYQYKRRAPRSKGADYIKPFLVIIIFAAIIIAGWKLLGTALDGGTETLSNEKVFLEIETGSAKAMTASDTEWKNVPTSIYLYEGESLKTQSDGRATLKFFERDTVRLDKSAEVKFASLSRDTAGTMTTLELEDGMIWVEIDNTGTESTEFTITTGLLSLKSSGGVFGLNHPGMLYVLEGSVRAEIMNGAEVVKTSTIGVGQEMIVDEQIAADLAEGLDKEVIFALDDAFKSSNWYRWNQQQGGVTMLDDVEISNDETDTEDLELNEEDESSEEEVVEEEVVEEEEEEIDVNDKEAPTVPQISEPGSNGDTVTLDTVEEIISGSVSSDTEVVIVNDYRLTKYVPGSKRFEYTAKIIFKNLEVGENEYKVIAEDKAGNQSETAVITLVLPQDVFDEAQPEDEAEEEGDSTPAASSSGGVTITAPNGGENVITSETSFEIKGEVPSNTAKVVVNNYTLSGYSEGDSTFLYRASSTMGNLEIGELNTYAVKAYDADDELLGSASMTIDVESSSNGEGAPVVTMPTSASTYETTLDQLVVGGSVGKWITRVRINGDNLTEYIPGTEEWKKTMTLQAGENSYKICAEKEGEEQGCSSITINYQN